jgi:quaternary ammonium compound-resistance protein SugE
LLAAFLFMRGRALQALEVGVAYAVWTWIGVVGTLVIGALRFGEALSAMKMAGIMLWS